MKTTIYIGISLILLFSIWVSDILLERKEVSTHLSLQVSTYADELDELTIDEVKNKLFQPSLPQFSFPKAHKALWIRIILKNLPTDKGNYSIHLNRAYLSRRIQVFDLLSEIDTKTSDYNFLDPDIESSLTGSSIVIPLNLRPGETRTLYLKRYPLTVNFVDISLHDEYSSIQHLINKSLLSNSLISFILALAIYNLILFSYLKRNEFLYYFFYLLNIVIGLSFLYGSLLHHAIIFGEFNSLLSLSSTLVNVFLILFIKSLFDTKKENLLINKWLNSAIVLSLLFFTTGLFISVEFIMNSIQYLYGYTYLILIYFSITFYRKEHPLINIFILALTAYLIGTGILLLSLIGIIPLSTLTLHSSGIGFIIEAYLFSYLLSNRITLLEKIISQQKNKLSLMNKKSKIGDMIATITHQLKQPLNVISSSVSILQHKLAIQQPISNQYLSKELHQVEDKIQYISETINDFTTFYKPDSAPVICNISQLINNCLKILHEEILSQNIIITLDLEPDLVKSLYRNDLFHICLNILQNSKDAIESNAPEHKEIMIKTGQHKDKIIIEFEDTAGGIKEDSLTSIFDEFYSTKNENTTTGLGLYIVKYILEDRLKGSIEVKNTTNGVLFRLAI